MDFEKSNQILLDAKAYNDLHRERILSGEATQKEIAAWNANQIIIRNEEISLLGHLGAYERFKNIKNILT